MISIKTTTMPTYLKLLLQEDEDIQLIFEERAPKRSDSCEKESIINEDIADESTFEVTGTPLQTDLGDDGTELNLLDEIFVKPSSWSLIENNQYSQDLDTARTKLNENIPTHKLVFCLCDGKDARKTVVLGGSVIDGKFTRILVQALSCCKEKDEITTLSYIQADHLKRIRQSSQTQITTIKTYNLYGFDLKNCISFQNLDFNGNIRLDATTNLKKSKEENYLMNLQVISGHKNSPLHNFWLELILLENLMRKLDGSVNGDTKISLHSLNCREIKAQISELLHSVEYLRKTDGAKLNLDDLRPLNSLDKLWNILKSCENVADLCDSIHFFLEGLIEATSNHIHSFSSENIVGAICRRIFERKMSVSCLSFMQSLELLIELGLEKLKVDYLAIVKHFCLASVDAFTKKWMKLDSTNLLADGRLTSRFSINRVSVLTKLSDQTAKISYLFELHGVCDLILLLKTNLPSLDDKRLRNYAGSLCKILQKPKNLVVKQNRLCESSIIIRPLDATGLIENNLPNSMTTRLFSITANSEVETVYHFSEKPIFPPSILEEYDIGVEENDGMMWYVAKLEKFVNKIMGC